MNNRLQFRRTLLAPALVAAVAMVGGSGIAFANDPGKKAGDDGPAHAQHDRARSTDSGRDDMARQDTRANDAGDSSQPIDDTWITTKVKASLLADDGVAGLDIDVETVDGVVHLRGNVDSERQAEQAKSIARGIEGVRSVDASGLDSQARASR